MKELPLWYQGSVKNIRVLDGTMESPENFLVEFTDQYSVFDYGVMPDAVPTKGAALARIGSSLFERMRSPREWEIFLGSEAFRAANARIGFAPELLSELRREGLRNHYRGVLLKDGTRLSALPKDRDVDLAGFVVEALQVVRPERMGRKAYGKSAAGKASDGPAGSDSEWYDYARSRQVANRKLVPLEVVFRHSVVAGSSILKREPKLKAGDRFAVPRIEFFTKLEPQDRFLSESEAFALAGVSSPMFGELIERTLLASLILGEWMATLGIELIDGKFEWGLDREGRWMMIDSIGPDELRLMEGTAELSKELLRNHYRGSAWYVELEELKKKGLSWKDVELPVPPPAPRGILETVGRYYGDLGARLLRTWSEDALFRGRERAVLLGNGGREHAIARRLLETGRLEALLWADADRSQIENLAALFPGVELGSFAAGSPAEIVEKAREAGATLAVLGSDAFIAEGYANRFSSVGIACFGATREAGKLEWSKSFAKEILRAADAPTPGDRIVRADDWKDAVASLDWKRPWVLKADGLALGKGVRIVASAAEAADAMPELFGFSNEILVEEFVAGREVSAFYWCDGERAVFADFAQDYKRLADGNEGPNTGGMGAYAPAADLPTGLSERVARTIVEPTLAEMRRRGTPYRGMLYVGLMLAADGTPFVLEFNARFGDPEAQVVLPRLRGDLVAWMRACADPSALFSRTQLRARESAVVVVAASSGYPEQAKTGVEIEGFPIAARDAVWGGVRRAADGRTTTKGGRVVGALGFGASLPQARAQAYAVLLGGGIAFSGMQYRRDIAAGAGKRYAILASGRGSNARALLEAERAGKHGGACVGIVSDRVDAGALAIAREFGVAAVHAADESATLAQLRAWGAEWVALCGYMKIVSPAFIDAFRDAEGRSRVLNIHPSLLPAFKGTHAYRQAFEAGTKLAGATVHRVEPELDAGPILAQESFPLAGCKSAEDVEARGLKVEHRIYAETLAGLFKASEKGPEKGAEKR